MVMNKKEVLVDTVFLEKLSCDGKNLENFKKVLLDLDYKPVVHPYIATNELDMHSYFDELVAEGFVRVANYNEFLGDDGDKELYESYFVDIHNSLRQYLEAAGGKKQLEKLVLPAGQDVFTYRKAAMSLGDVHMILMAFFARMPIILTEDSDIDILRSITKRKMCSETYTLNIYNAVDVLIMIAEKEKSILEKKDLVDIVKSIGERKHQSDINQAWNRTHLDT
jgi:isocitrate dehydrogenase kinase/phosphatase